jgi:CheY-like chemotaxis protein
MANARDKTVLVVDDEPNIRQYLKAILEDAEFNVLTAADGEEALRMVRQRRPDFISLDLIMPRKSGHKLLFELKRDRELSRIPVLVVTAHAQDELGKGDLDDLLKNRIMSGPETYLEKPVDPRAYLRCIQRTLGVEERPEVTDGLALREELQTRMRDASPEALRQAVEVLRNRKGVE